MPAIAGNPYKLAQGGRRENEAQFFDFRRVAYGRKERSCPAISSLTLACWRSCPGPVKVGSLRREGPPCGLWLVPISIRGFWTLDNPFLCPFPERSRSG